MYTDANEKLLDAAGIEDKAAGIEVWTHHLTGRHWGQGYSRVNGVMIAALARLHIVTAAKA
jgi:hypothetical protein